MAAPMYMVFVKTSGLMYTKNVKTGGMIYGSFDKKAGLKDGRIVKNQFTLRDRGGIWIALAHM